MHAGRKKYEQKGIKREGIVQANLKSQPRQQAGEMRTLLDIA